MSIENHLSAASPSCPHTSAPSSPLEASRETKLHLKGRQEKWCPLQLQGEVITTHVTLLWTFPYTFSLNLAPEIQTLISSDKHDISIWLSNARLKLSRSETELLIFCRDSLTSANGTSIYTVAQTKNTRVILDSFLFLI